MSSIQVSPRTKEKGKTQASGLILSQIRKEDNKTFPSDSSDLNESQTLFKTEACLRRQMSHRFDVNKINK